MSEEAAKGAGEAAKGAGFWASKVAAPSTKSWEQVKGAFKEGTPWGERGVAFGRVVGTGIGLSIAAGALKSKDADGNDRSALARVGNLVIGGGIAGASVLVGHGR